MQPVAECVPPDPDCRLQRIDGAALQPASDESVVAALQSQRSVHQFGDEGGVTSPQLCLYQRVWESKVGIGVVHLDGGKHLVRRQAGQVCRGSAFVTTR